MSRIQIIERCDDCKYFETDPQDTPELWGKNVCHHPNIQEDGEPWILGSTTDVEIPDFCPLDIVVFDPDNGIPDSGQVFEVTED